MKYNNKATSLGNPSTPGHIGIERPMEAVKAARSWGRSNPDPAPSYPRRKNRGTGNK